MNKRLIPLFAFLSLAPLTSHALINGKLAPAGMFPTVGSMSGCTATKISPRHYVLAAHCYMSRIGSENNEILLEHTVDGRRQARIVRAREHQVTLHPSWLETCTKIACSGLEIGTPQDNPRKVDAAIVKLEWAEPSVPFSPVDFEKVLPGDSLVLAGRGCTAGIGEPGTGLRYNGTTAVHHDALKHAGSLYRPVADAASESNLVTPGYTLDKKYPSICPGDSGGPVFKTTNGVRKLAGIHADYTFYGDYEAGGISVTNLHTRVDDDSHYAVGRWIRDAISH